MNITETRKKMTLEEKLNFLIGADNWHTVAIERLGVPQITVSDGPEGLRLSGKEGKDRDSVAFPSNSAMAATWNPELAYEAGRAIAGDCIDHKVDILLGPGVNMKRSPLCGRNFEYYSEDPYLAGKMGTAFVRGVQSRGVGTSLKHFACNNQETDRNFGGSEVDERTLREIYLRAFETVAKEAHPWTVMCAYNRLNGVFCSENPYLLDEILRKEWGYDGMVMSDWSAVHDHPASLRASLELEMPYRKEAFPELKKAYEAGEITDAQIDRAVDSILKLVDRVQNAKEQREAVHDTTKDRLASARKAAEEAVTLLKNENGILPIHVEKAKKIAVIGGCAETPFAEGGGSARVDSCFVETPLEEMKKIAGDKIDYVTAYTWWDGSSRPNAAQYREALDAVAAAETAVVFVGENWCVETEGGDRTTIRLHPDLERLICDAAALNPNTVVVVEAGSAIDMSPWIDRIKGVVFTWYCGSCCGSAIAEVLFGRVNPSGKIAETFPLSLEDTPAYGDYPGLPDAWYGEGVLTGYRHYDTKRKDVLFPFGFGLSYTTFAYGNFSVSSETITKEKPVTVSFSVKNTGTVEGKETAQLYVGDVSASVRRPEKELKHFQKISLKPGEEKTLSFDVTWQALAYYSTVWHGWTVEPGMFRICVGASSRDIRFSAYVKA